MKTLLIAFQDGERNYSVCVETNGLSDSFLKIVLKVTEGKYLKPIREFTYDVPYPLMSTLEFKSIMSRRMANFAAADWFQEQGFPEYLTDTIRGIPVERV